jgi:phosphate transport system permease protein
LSGVHTAGRAWAGYSRFVDVAFQLLCQAAAMLVVVLAVALVLVLWWQALPSLKINGLGFLASSDWDPVDAPGHRKFGALAFVYGTIVTSVIAMVLAVPFGVGTATFLAEIAPHWLRRSGSFLVEMLAAIPSVVYGFWGLFVFAPWLQWFVSLLGGPSQSSTGLLPAGLILGIMIVPYIAAVSFDVIRAVPRSQREGSLALGATRWQMIRTVVLVYARPGIIGGCFLALGRALGETMAVTMLIGNRPDIGLSLFAKGNSIPSVIANEFMETTYEMYHSALVELGLVLLLVSVGFSALGRLLIWRMNRSRGKPFFGLRLWPSPAPESPTVPGTSDRPGSTPDSSLPRPVRAPGNIRSSFFTDVVMTLVLAVSFVVTLVPLFLILGYLLYRGATSMDLNFFTKLPAPMDEPGGGMVNAFYGSFLMVALATAFSVPVGVLAAIYLTQYRSDRIGPTVRFVAEMLGSVPSVVIGIFGYYLIVQPITGKPSGLAGAFALGVMMIPIVMRASEETLKLVPQSLRQASDALGAAKWQTVLRVMVPAALPGIITAVFLAIARVAGETAPLLLTASSNRYWPRSLNDYTPSLPVYIFTYAISPSDDWKRQAWAAAFVLVVAIMLLNFGIRALTGKRVMLASQAD